MAKFINHMKWEFSQPVTYFPIALLIILLSIQGFSDWCLLNEINQDRDIKVTRYKNGVIPIYTDKNDNKYWYNNEPCLIPIEHKIPNCSKLKESEGV